MGRMFRRPEGKEGVIYEEKEDIFSNGEDVAEDEFETEDATDFFQNEYPGEDEFEIGDAAEFFENEDAG
ncbi:hypothetical protein V6N11_035460 [Hibiscus sabdariffa]|uniref:Uncharacterized protein n=1 Tax=Hibiscus sabdariffa TaxID=183260 RepID=A0ABR2R0H5_9ROSI